MHFASIQCTKNASADLAERAYSTSSDSLAGFRGRGKDEEGGWERKGRRGSGKGAELEQGRRLAKAGPGQVYSTYMHEDLTLQS